MQQILVYADSLSWGIIPDTRGRLPFEHRWPGVCEIALRNAGQDIRVLENCLNGRRTVWSDPFKDGRDGSEGLAQVMEIHAPLQMVVLMLGNNDFQCTHDNSAWLSAQGTAKLIDIIRQAPIEPGMPVPEILIIAPPAIVQPKGAIAHKFQDAAQRWPGLRDALCEVAAERQCHFMDAGAVTDASRVDGIHLDADQHKALGLAVAKVLQNLS